MKKLFILLTFILITSCSIKKNNTVTWDDNINNPDNIEFVEEIAFNLDIETSNVTQQQFNDRYCK